MSKTDALVPQDERRPVVARRARLLPAILRRLAPFAGVIGFVVATVLQLSRGDRSPGNAGLVLVLDVAVPLLLIVLYCLDRSG